MLVQLLWLRALGCLGAARSYIPIACANGVSTLGVGSIGQEVVKSTYGTFHWMSGATKRIYVPNGSEVLLRRLQAVFAPLDPVPDSAAFNVHANVHVAEAANPKLDFRL